MSIKTIIARIPASWKLSIAVGLVIFVTLLGLQFGARITNAVSRTIFNGKNAVITSDIQKDLDNKDAAKEVATKALQELADKKVELAKAESELANAQQKLQLAETILADKTKTTDSKIKAYQEAVSAAPTVHLVPESISEQCSRAKALGLELSICQQ